MKKLRIHFFAFVIFFVAFGLSGAKAELAVPRFESLVTDQAGILDSELHQKLLSGLTAFQQKTGPQIALLTIPSLEGEAIEAYSIRVADQWKLGDKKRDDGILVLVAMKEHGLRIEVGQGLEGQIPDALAGRIINETMVPYFKQGNPGIGAVQGLRRITNILGGDIDGIPNYADADSGKHGELTLIIIILLILFSGRLLSRIGNIFGSPVGGGFGGGSGAGSSSSGSSGGFGGFLSGGGGGFSGGGASGSW